VKPTTVRAFNLARELGQQPFLDDDYHDALALHLAELARGTYCLSGRDGASSAEAPGMTEKDDETARYSG
jgi:hypothetical protein